MGLYPVGDRPRALGDPTPAASAFRARSLAARVSTHGDPEHHYDDQGTEHVACVDAFEAPTVGSIAIEDGLGSG